MRPRKIAIWRAPAAALAAVAMLGVYSAPGMAAARPPAPVSLRTVLREGGVRQAVLSPRGVGWARANQEVWHITGDGRDWTLSWETASGSVQALDATGPWSAWIATTASAASQAVMLRRTTDGGRTWRVTALRTPWPVNGVHLANLGGSLHAILISGPVGTQAGPEAIWLVHDGRIAAEPIFASSSDVLETLRYLSQNVVLAPNGGVAGGQQVSPPLFRSADGGRTWDPLRLPAPRSTPSSRRAAFIGPPNFVVAIAPEALGAQVAYLALALPEATVYRTENGGRSWTPLMTPDESTGSIQGMVWTNARDGYLVVRDKGHGRLYRTENGGADWQALAPMNLASSLQMDAPQDGWALVNDGAPNAYGAPEALVHTTDGGRTWGVVPLP